jgi:hypothetical protein
MLRLDVKAGECLGRKVREVWVPMTSASVAQRSISNKMRPFEQVHQIQALA